MGLKSRLSYISIGVTVTPGDNGKDNMSKIAFLRQNIYRLLIIVYKTTSANVNYFTMAKQSLLPYSFPFLILAPFSQVVLVPSPNPSVHCQVSTEQNLFWRDPAKK